MKIPAGVSSGTRLKLPKKGIKKNTEIGDLLVEISIQIPKEPSQLYRQMAEKLSTEPFYPRIK